MQGTVERWTTALLSGEYVQGTARLSRYDAEKNTVTHCVMGVLASLDFQLQKAIESDIDRDGGKTWRDAGRITRSGEERLRQMGVGWLIDETTEPAENHGDGEPVTCMCRLISENDAGVPFRDLVQLIREMAGEPEVA